MWNFVILGKCSGGIWSLKKYKKKKNPVYSPDCATAVDKHNRFSSGCKSLELKNKFHL